MSLLEGISYNGDAPTTNMVPAGPTTLPPESNGERVWLFACTRQDKYGSLPNVNSIGDALSLADEIRSPDKALAKLITDDDLMAIANEFHRAQGEAGMIGLADRVETCYRDAARAEPARIRSRTAYCLTLDVVAYKFDASFRAEFKQRTSHDMPASTPFYEDAAFSARLDRHAVATTVDHSLPDFSAFNTFADKVFVDLNHILEQEPQSAG